MTTKTHLGNIMETQCPYCRSRFRITDQQLQVGLGKARCGQCRQAFNALQSLKSFEGHLPANDQPENFAPETGSGTDARSRQSSPSRIEPENAPRPELSLHEAMYGEGHSWLTHFAPAFWFAGILLLLVLGIAQAMYYQRYQLIDDPRFQQQVLMLCKLVPCGESKFASIRQIKLLERNVYTHPVVSNALMVTGSFVNEAPFAQRMPGMLVSLFDLKGNLIANRVFEPTEYLQAERSRYIAEPARPVQFRLEIIDPGTDALTYEFEFY